VAPDALQPAAMPADVAVAVDVVDVAAAAVDAVPADVADVQGATPTAMSDWTADAVQQRCRRWR